ncbi:DUF4178 domain-containing protein [Leptolyngbya sp. FACHB-671]|uniref:DUF4178 domain-containing protein n=1 Tax=Leptolyngbya sp. FACHB-671 TaxID=2692812 RepID=UPI0018EF7295|nr:DUF4178 domain-containing protein [Leptolyngbya sp. FACHB-671]
MLTFIWISIIAIVITATLIVVYRSQLSLPVKRRRSLSANFPNVLTLRIGDIVQYLDQDWVVEDKLIYTSHNYRWIEYLLQDNEEIRWLSIEEDDQVKVAWLETTQALNILDYPPEQICFGEMTYYLDERGTAQMHREGATLNQAEQCQYFDYSSNGNHILCIENWSGDVEVSVGRMINPRSLTILGGDGQRIYGV